MNWYCLTTNWARLSMRSLSYVLFQEFLCLFIKKKKKQLNELNAIVVHAFW